MPLGRPGSLGQDLCVCLPLARLGVLEGTLSTYSGVRSKLNLFQDLLNETHGDSDRCNSKRSLIPTHLPTSRGDDPEQTLTGSYIPCKQLGQNSNNW